MVVYHPGDVKKGYFGTRAYTSPGIHSAGVYTSTHLQRSTHERCIHTTALPAKSPWAHPSRLSLYSPAAVARETQRASAPDHIMTLCPRYPYPSCHHNSTAVIARRHTHHIMLVLLYCCRVGYCQIRSTAVVCTAVLRQAEATLDYSSTSEIRGRIQGTPTYI